MGAPFAGYAGLQGIASIAQRLPSGSGKWTTGPYINVPGTLWSLPQTINTISIYSAAGGFYPDVLATCFKEQDFVIAGVVRNDYNPFANNPLYVGASVVVNFSMGVGTPAVIPAMTTGIMISPEANGMLEYGLAFRGQWFTKSFEQ